jgi:hypothetical protein
MPDNKCIAVIRGVPNNPEVNVRSSSGTKYQLVFKIPVGTVGCIVSEVRPDDEQKNLNGKIYQWFKLTFPDGRTGWVRDDLLDIEGDASAFGYGVLAAKRYAFELVRAAVEAAQQPPTAAPVTPTPVTPITPPAPAAPKETPASAAPAPSAAAAPSATNALNPERVRKAAFNITGAFEGGGYATYQNYDKGIISYGRFQFTLDSGSLFTVVERYLAKSNTATAAEMRGFVERLRTRDEGLRNDSRLKVLLIEAATEPAMQEVQDQVATEKYWNLVQDLSIKPRGIKLPLSQALIYDMSIQHGPRHSMLTESEEAVGVPPKSVVGQNGASEEKLISKLAEVRRDLLYRLAERMNLPGLKPRGDFWVELTKRGDWNLQGDAQGMITVTTGKNVQVKNP